MESGPENLTLSPADAVAADAVLNGEAGGEPARKARVEAWLQVLESSPMPEPAGDLAVRALAAVQADRMRVPARAEPAPPRMPGVWRRRMAEFGAMAVAAMLLLAVTMEGVGQARRSSARSACAANLKQFVGAFGNYSSQGLDGELPMLAMPANGSWLHGNVEGTTAAVNNAANLLPLVTRQFVPVKALYCPGAGVPEGSVVVSSDRMPAIGYSYRDMAAPEKPRWDRQQGTIVMADKNPVFGESVRPELADQNSANHDGKGNYLLRADGSVSWETRPDVGPDRDNIWTIGSGKERLAAYTGREVPAGLTDVFVCP